MPTKASREKILERLDYYYHIIYNTILCKQHPASGLMPASTAITVCHLYYLILLYQ